MRIVNVSSLVKNQLVGLRVDTVAKASGRRSLIAWLARAIMFGGMLVLILSACGNMSQAPGALSSSVTSEPRLPGESTQPIAPTSMLSRIESPDPSPSIEPTALLEPMPMLPTPIPLRLDRVPAQVVEVVDGDTLRVVTGGKRHTVQLIGINAPETKHVVRGVDCFGPEAAEAMRQLVEGKTVYLEKDATEADVHHRHPRYVYVFDDDGQELHINWELVWRGYAKVRETPPDLKYQAAYWEAQREAEAAQRGLWAPETCAGQTKRK